MNRRMSAMARLHDPSAALSAPSKRAGGRWLYPLLLAVQTAGAVLLAWEALPIYRRALATPTAHDSEASILALMAGVLLQLAYWIGYRIRPAPPRFVNVALGHIVLFVARLLFVLATAIFSFLFVTNALQAEIPVARYAVILFGLFSLFCYVREVERLGTYLLGKPE